MNRRSFRALAMCLCAAAPLVATAGGRWHHRVTFPLRDALPQPRLTPGALNLAVTQTTLDRTICVRGYTRSIRPPERYTERLKRQQIRAYGYADHWLRDYAEDHLVPLELGGAPASPQNLWPQPDHVVGGWGSYAKDHLENRLNHLVCSGRLPLRAAQRAIAANWIRAYRRFLGPVPDNRPTYHYGD